MEKTMVVKAISEHKSKPDISDLKILCQKLAPGRESAPKDHKLIATDVAWKVSSLGRP